MPVTQQDISRCMLIDQPRLRRRLQKVRTKGRAGRGSLAALEQEIERSQQRRERRAAMALGAVDRVWENPVTGDLPVVRKRREIARAISDNQVIVLCGETGSGKTTQLPKICLELGRGAAGMIGHTQPRRIAARSVAARIAEELSSPLGRHVGYKMRFGDTVGEDALVKIMTDGILLAETRSDRDLRQYDAIIIDEAHERSLNIDFLLGYLKRLLPKRPDLKLIITSATIDPHRFSAHFDNAPIIEVSGRVHPVEVRYRPLVSDDPDEEDRDLKQGVLDAVREAIDAPGAGPGDMLVFLSGEREIRETARALGRHTFGPTPVEVLPLYARLPAEEQSRIFASHQGRRIILATNIAETSLTVPNIRCVIDAGRARISRYSARSGVQRLPIEAVSRASADQRKGRCGRVAPGVCIRLYSEDDYLAREEFTPPEILRTNLASVILQMKSLRLGPIEEFPFIEPPRWGMITDGHSTLHEIGAIDQWGEITPLGEELARLPIDPRLARMILAGREEGCLREVTIIAAALSIEDPRQRPHEKQEQADEAHARFAHPESDFLSLLRLWRFYQQKHGELGESRLRKLCRQCFLSFARMREWRDVDRQLRQILREADLLRSPPPPPKPTPSMPGKKRSDTGEGDEDLPHRIHRAILAGLLSRIGVRGAGHEYTGAHGRKFHIFPGSAAFTSAPPWIMAAELIETTRLYAHDVAKIDPRWAERLARHLVKRSYSDPHWREKRGDVGAIERVTLFGLELVKDRRVSYGRIDPRASREIFIRNALVEGRWQTSALFFAHNRALVEEIREIEEKTRRRGVLVDDEAIFAFYDARVPDGICTGRAFDAWRTEAEKDKPRLLYMSREQLLVDRGHGVTAERFPEHLLIGGSPLPLSYRFEPGHEDDGVTITVPLAMLPQASAERLHWLVPGLLDEKIAALIKSLPKAIRRNLVPAPQFAAACAGRIEFGQGDLAGRVARTLSEMTGCDVPADAFDLSALPAHLCMNVRVVDDEGREVARGRDLATLRDRVSGCGASDGAVPSRRRQAAEEGGERHPLERDGILRWDFDALPEEVSVSRAGVTMAAFPALVDQRDSVAVRLLTGPDEAHQSTRRAIRRLIMLQFPDEMRYQRQNLPGFDQMATLWATLGGDAALLREQMLARSVDCAFIDDPAQKTPIRNRAAFEQALDDGWHRFPAAVEHTSGLVREILESRHELAQRLSDLRGARLAEPRGEIEAHLEHLLHENFIEQTAQPWLEQFPRYLRGDLSRIEKILNGKLARDRQLAAEFAPYWCDYVALAQSRAARGAGVPKRDPLRLGSPLDRFAQELDHLRWMLEEYRIALFAQELGTAIKVSAKRLDAQRARLSMA